MTTALLQSAPRARIGAPPWSRSCLILIASLIALLPACSKPLSADASAEGPEGGTTYVEALLAFNWRGARSDRPIQPFATLPQARAIPDAAHRQLRGLQERINLAGHRWNSVFVFPNGRSLLFAPNNLQTDGEEISVELVIVPDWQQHSWGVVPDVRDRSIIGPDTLAVRRVSADGRVTNMGISLTEGWQVEWPFDALTAAFAPESRLLARFDREARMIRVHKVDEHGRPSACLLSLPTNVSDLTWICGGRVLVWVVYEDGSRSDTYLAKLTADGDRVLATQRLQRTDARLVAGHDGLLCRDARGYSLLHIDADTLAIRSSKLVRDHGILRTVSPSGKAASFETPTTLFGVGTTFVIDLTDDESWRGTVDIAGSNDLDRTQWLIVSRSSQEAPR